MTFTLQFSSRSNLMNKNPISQTWKSQGYPGDIHPKIRQRSGHGPSQPAGSPSTTRKDWGKPWPCMLRCVARKPFAPPKNGPIFPCHKEKNMLSSQAVSGKLYFSWAGTSQISIGWIHRLGPSGSSHSSQRAVSWSRSVGETTEADLPPPEGLKMEPERSEPNLNFLGFQKPLGKTGGICYIISCIFFG